MVNNHPKCLNIQTDNRDQRIEKEEINRFLCDEDEEEDSGDEDFDEDKLDQMEDTVKVFIFIRFFTKSSLFEHPVV